MAKQQALLAGLLAVVILGAAAYWFTQKQAEVATPAPAPVTKAEPTAKAPVQTPAQAQPNAEKTPTQMQDEIDRLAEEIMQLETVDPDKIALIEEVRDQLRAEQAELSSRLEDLKAQLKDSEQLIKLKSAQIEDLETKLQAQ